MASSTLLLEPQRWIPPRGFQVLREIAELLHGEGLLAGRLLEEEEGGYGFAVHVLGFEDVVHLLGDPQGLVRPALLRVDRGEVDGDASWIRVLLRRKYMLEERNREVDSTRK